MKILVPVDGSEDAYSVLRGACRLALRIGYSVVALHVDRSGLYTPEFLRWYTIKRRIETEFDILAKEVVKRSYGIGGEMGVAMEVVMSDGEPAREIADYAYDNGVIKLIIMGHGRHGGHGTLRGATEQLVESVTKTVILHQNKPVLVTNNSMEISSILIVIEGIYDTDGSSRSLVKYAGMLARALRARVGLVCLIPDLLAIAVDYGHIGEVPYIRERKSFRRFETLYRQHTQVIISESRQLLEGMDVALPVATRETDEADEVMAEAHNYDLIAICPRHKDTHGTLTEISRTLLNNRALNTLFVQ
ncbi:MAG: universal stress protein [Nitrospirae bacterium]|nr:universal stress protein [Nitrospirota bacterium]